jgi:hypothetical protein
VSLWAYGCRGGGGAHGLYQRATATPPSMRELLSRAIADARARRRFPRAVITDTRAERARQRATRTDLWQGVYTDPDDVEAFRAWLRLMFDPQRAHEMPGQPPAYGQTALRFHAGFMTFRYFTLLADDRASLGQAGALDSLEAVREFDRCRTVHDEMIRIEQLEPDLLRILERAGYELRPEQRSELEDRCRRKTNASPHRTDREYFDDESLDLVARRERFLIEKYDYAPPV